MSQGETPNVAPIVFHFVLSRLLPDIDLANETFGQLPIASGFSKGSRTIASIKLQGGAVGIVRRAAVNQFQP
jgi:hypothetical protein